MVMFQAALWLTRGDTAVRQQQRRHQTGIKWQVAKCHFCQQHLQWPSGKGGLLLGSVHREAQDVMGQRIAAVCILATGCRQQQRYPANCVWILVLCGAVC
jgi:hypothetical protein